MKNAKLDEQIAEVPLEWAAHISPGEFSCAYVLQQLVCGVIEPIYSMGGRRVRPDEAEVGEMSNMSSKEARAMEESESDASDAECALAASDDDDA